MPVKGTKSTGGLNEPSEDTLWVHTSDGLEFDSGNIVRLMFHYSTMTELGTRIKLKRFMSDTNFKWKGNNFVLRFSPHLKKVFIQ